MKHSVLVDRADVGGIDFACPKNLGCSFRTACIARHDGVARTNDSSAFVDTNGGMLHRCAHKTWLAAILAKFVTADDTCLGGSVGVVEAGVGERLAELFHIVLGDGSCASLDEVNLLADCCQLLRGDLQQHPDAGGNKECGNFGVG